MEKTAINFRQERDFGEVFGATFDFIRQEYKKLGSMLLYYVLPFLVIAALLMIWAQYYYKDFLTGFAGSSPDLVFSMFGEMLLYWLLLMLSVLIANTMIIAATYSYIFLYVKKGKDAFEVTDVWNMMKSKILPIVGANILVGLITGIGFVFCIIPGIYLGISLSVILMALIYEDNGFGNAFSRSFELTKQNWWMTLLIVIIAFLLTYLLGIIIQLPAMIIGIGSFWTTIRDTIANPENTISPESFFNTTYIVVTSISSVLTYVLYVIPHFIIAFWYFSLVETKERPSLMEKIEQIGGNE